MVRLTGVETVAGFLKILRGLFEVFAGVVDLADRGLESAHLAVLRREFSKGVLGAQSQPIEVVLLSRLEVAQELL